MYNTRLVKIQKKKVGLLEENLWNLNRIKYRTEYAIASFERLQSPGPDDIIALQANIQRCEIATALYIAIARKGSEKPNDVFDRRNTKMVELLNRNWLTV